MRRKFPMPCRRTDQAASFASAVARGLPIPRQQRVQLIDLGASGDDALENVSKIVPRVDVVKFCRVDERRENGPRLGPAFTTGEQVVLLSQPDRLDAAFDRIAVDLDAPIIDESRQAIPMVEGVADSLAKAGFLQDFQQSRLEPGLEVLDQRSGVGLSNRSSLRRRQTANAILNGVEHRDPLQ